MLVCILSSGSEVVERLQHCHLGCCHISFLHWGPVLVDFVALRNDQVDILFLLLDESKHFDRFFQKRYLQLHVGSV